MQWNFPIEKTIECHNCGKEFRIVLVDRESERHPCPNCGTVHIFDFDATEKKVIEATEEAIRKAFGKR